ncbi:MAG: hypothetical protein UU93_C0001G0066 [Candidatus Amesbacteria bacterium GW2011_GWA2_42_12]|uniref:Fibronectin type-III domain-containing protein n=1 Tax=Candidatus Amesbacteria bacterium GW2011_GWA2_42_12 TaxID=1618356 RepID=A0A0G0Y948_9BACT|nr:MAG: hypothetical protein UU93_C0001G0066 [Candidatus Amesbacteria bacterium GW2011_GWA2_42_12]
MKKAELTIPTILGILVLMAGLISGVYFLRSPLRTLVGASAEETPQEVKIVNTTDISFVVSWITDISTSGFIQYNEAGKNPNLTVSDDRDLEKGSIGNYFTHFVTVRGLKPATKYNFKIGSGSKLYEAGTGVTLLNPPPANVAYGQILTSAGDPAEGAIVYLNMVGIDPQATLVKSSGTWAIPISTARTADLTSFASYDKQNSKLDIFVQGADAGTKSLSVTTASIAPVQVITLGSTDITDTISPTPIPVADNPDSKFSATAINPVVEATAAGQLLILTPQTNEKINTSRPEIIGKGPAKSTVTIKIHSNEVITQTVQTDSQGNFSYSVPADLSPGEHTITISTLINGVIKMVTKTFTVEAAGESVIPAKSATPSASIKPSPIPTVPPRVVIPSTESGTPASGDLTPTLFLLILGAGLTMSGLFAYKRIN